MTTDHKLPDGWRLARFGDVVREVRTATKNPKADGLTRAVGLEHLDSESSRLRRWNELEDLPDGTSFTRVFRSGQVLFGKRRAYQRKVAVPDFDGICSSDILVFEPSTDEVLPEFLPYLVQSDGFFDHALGTSAGSLSPRTKWQELSKYEFPLPPTEQQASIAGAVAAQDQGIESYRSVEDRLDALRRAVFSEALGGPKTITTAWGRCRSDVAIRPLGDVATVARGASPRPKGNPLYFAKERTPYHWIKISDLSRSRDGKYLTDTAEFLTEEGATKSRRVGPGALLLTNCATVGIPIFSGIEGCIHDGFLVFDDFKSVCADYLYRFFEFLTPWFEDVAQTGTQANLNTGILKALEVPVLPAAEQARVVDQLDSSDAVEVAAANARRSISRSRAALLNWLLARGPR